MVTSIYTVQDILARLQLGLYSKRIYSSRKEIMGFLNILNMLKMGSIAFSDVEQM
jgi:hypothetical protein